MNAILVNGLSGKMGVAIKNLVLDYSDFKIVKKLIDSDLIIDFSRPESTMLLLQEAEEHSIPLIIGTTGFSEVEVNLIERASKKIPIVLSYNMSKGIHYLKKNIKKFLENNSDSFECKIIETHHTEKVDAPSGTSIELKKFIELNNDQKNVTIIEIESKRMLDVFGIHEVIFSNHSYKISFKHEALSRNIFATGALYIAKLINGKSPGMYSVQDFFR